MSKQAKRAEYVSPDEADRIIREAEKLAYARGFADGVRDALDRDEQEREERQQHKAMLEWIDRQGRLLGPQGR
jgi:hypothetical protein